MSSGTARGRGRGRSQTEVSATAISASSTKSIFSTALSFSKSLRQNPKKLTKYPEKIAQKRKAFGQISDNITMKRKLFDGVLAVPNYSIASPSIRPITPARISAAPSRSVVLPAKPSPPPRKSSISPSRGPTTTSLRQKSAKGHTTQLRTSAYAVQVSHSTTQRQKSTASTSTAPASATQILSSSIPSTAHVPTTRSSRHVTPLKTLATTQNLRPATSNANGPTIIQRSRSTKPPSEKASAPTAQPLRSVSSSGKATTPTIQSRRSTSPGKAPPSKKTKLHFRTKVKKRSRTASSPPQPVVSDLFFQDLPVPESKSKESWVPDSDNSPTLTNSSFNSWDWSLPLESLTIRKCSHPIPVPNLGPSVSTLKNVEFSQLTSFPSVDGILRNCANLTCISFSNIDIVQKKHPETKFVLPHLRTLEILRWKDASLKHENWLLDCFNLNLIAHSLENFIFHGKACTSPPGPGSNSKPLANSSGAVASAAFTFIMKNCSSLQNVSLSGAGVTLMEQETRGSSSKFSLYPRDFEPQISFLRLGLNVEGLSELLQVQKNLRGLILTGSIPSFEKEYENLIYSCLESNQETLETFGLLPTLTSPVFKMFFGKVAHLDCQLLFKNCTKMKHLYLNVTVAATDSSSSPPQTRSCGTIERIHHLPPSLVSLELFHNQFSNEDLNSFFETLRRFTSLQKLVLSSHKSHSYCLQLPWVQNLTQLPSLKEAVFYSAKLRGEEVQQHMLSKPKGSITMEVFPDRISLGRPNPIIPRRPSRSLSSYYY